VILTTLTAIIAGVAGGIFTWRYESMQKAVFGLIGGYFVGLLVYSICLACGWNSVWGLMVLTILFALAGLILTFKYKDELVMELSSAIGSYLFMRGWSYMFGGYPSESVLIE